MYKASMILKLVKLLSSKQPFMYYNINMGRYAETCECLLEKHPPIALEKTKPRVKRFCM